MNSSPLEDDANSQIEWCLLKINALRDKLADKYLSHSRFKANKWLLAKEIARYKVLTDLDTSLITSLIITERDGNILTIDKDHTVTIHLKGSIKAIEVEGSILID